MKRGIRWWGDDEREIKREREKEGEIGIENNIGRK